MDDSGKTMKNGMRHGAMEKVAHVLDDYDDYAYGPYPMQMNPNPSDTGNMFDKWSFYIIICGIDFARIMMSDMHLS